MNYENKAAVILNSAIEFLAAKHGVTAQTIADAVFAKNEQICNQLAQVITWGIEEAAR